MERPLMEEAPPISVSLGVIHSLPAKLDKFMSSKLGPGVWLRRRERKAFEDLKSTLQNLIKSSQTEPHDVPAPASTAGAYWVKEVRELSYDIDDFMDELDHVVAVQRNLGGKLSQIEKLRKCLTRCRWVAREISKFRATLEEAMKWYHVQATTQQPSTVASDEHPFPPRFGVEAGRLIGVESSMKKIGGWLTDEGEQHLKVVSILGLGGVGKTALAQQLYLKIGRQFDCRAFVRSSQKPDINKLLTNILLQVRPCQPPNDFESCNLTYTIRAHLQHKRYFIAIDDLWAPSTWDIIHRALPDNNLCSVILITTEVDSVAQRCCGHNSRHIFRMEPLSDEDSRQLFKREQSNEVPYEIIRKCGGFPLATIATASLLARQRDPIEYVNDRWNSLGAGASAETNKTRHEMKQVLGFCYNNLPDYLKPCMLYLSMYQEDHVIRKDDLLKQWIAEGFICEKERKDMVKDASIYFDELVDRGMIQPVDVKYNGEVLSCSVHYIILQLIRYKSMEENFVTAISNSETNIRLPDKIHRLSVHFGNAEDAETPENLQVSRLRSLVFFGPLKCLPSIEEYRLLRVLIVHLWGHKDKISFDLTAVCKLFRLRHLEVACNATLNLQSQLQGLQFLETLKIDSRVTELPQGIVDLPRLLHLSVPGDTNLPNDIGKMTSLQTLGCFDLCKNSSDSLIELNNLWDLHLTCSTARRDNLEKNMERLAKVLPELQHLKSLTLFPPTGSSNANTLEASTSSDNISCDGLRKMFSLPEHLERLELSPHICTFSSFPKFIEQELSKLRILKIAVSELCQNDVDTLKQLSALTFLSLYVRALAKRIIFHKDGFGALKRFKFISTALRIEIVEGAMPNVQRLKLGFSANTTDENGPEHCGFQHLRGLEEIFANIGSADADEKRREAAEFKLKAAFKPCEVNVKWVHSIFYGHQGKTTEAQKGQLLEKTYEITNEGSYEQYRIGVKGSVDHTNRRADRRIAVSMESTSHMQRSGMKNLRMADGVLVEARRVMKYMTGQLKREGFRVENELISINVERELINSIIQKKLENSPGALPDRLVSQLQHLVYDIEDFIAICNSMRVSSRKKMSNSARVRQRACVLEHMRHIVPLKRRIQDWKQCIIPGYGGATAVASCGPPAGSSLPPYVHQDKLVGMDEPVKELLQLLSVSDNQRRVITITGYHGVGKTSLAASVYHNPMVLQTFNLRAWVVASECKNARDIINNITQQNLSRQRHNLLEKRWLVVIDGLQHAGLWYDIQGALAESGRGCRVIVTTSIQSVAAACSPERYTYRMRVLDSSKSEDLFWAKVASRMKRTPALDYDLEDTFRKCDGLPLALVGAANYLRAKGQNQHQLEPGPQAFEKVNRVLMQCYDSLPDYGHRACMLSLSIFPKGHDIKRKKLIRTWVAEGLVVGDVTHSAEKVASDCFDELIDKNVIEPVLFSNNSKVKRCRVHSVMQEFIVNKAISKDLVTLIRKNDPLSNNEVVQPVRRLSVHSGTTETGSVLATVRLDRVRSLTVCNGVLFYFQSCRLLRVLDLEDCKWVEEGTLDCICELILLKYLSLRGCELLRIFPKKIKKLECLETLDIRGTQVNKLSMEVIMLPQLAHLFGRFELPRELTDDKKKSKLKAFFSEKSVLQILSGIVIDENNGFELILRHLRYLRKVKIWRNHSTAACSDDRLAYSLQKCLSKENGLKSLSIDFDDQYVNFLDSVLVEGPCILNSIKLHGKLSSLPVFFTLIAVAELQLSFTGLSIEDLADLQHFPRLLYLKLAEGPYAFWRGRFVVRSGGFPSLRRLCFDAPELPEVQIDQGGMSSVTSLHLLCPKFAFCRKFSGIQHLKYLNEVALHPTVSNEELDDWKKEAKEHENRPRVYRHVVPA